MRSIGIDLWKLPNSFDIPKELCLCSRTLCNVQYIISNYFLRAMMYFGNREIHKTKFLLHGQFSWHFIQLGKYGLNHTVLVTASPGAHDGGLHRFSFPTVIASLQSHFAFCRELFPFVPVRSLVSLINCLCPSSCSGFWKACWRSTRRLRRTPNYRR